MEIKKKKKKKKNERKGEEKEETREGRRMVVEKARGESAIVVCASRSLVVTGERYMRIEGRKLGRGRTRIRLIGRRSLGVSGAVGIGMLMGDETSVGKPRAYINARRVDSYSQSKVSRCRRNSLCLSEVIADKVLPGPLDKGVSRSIKVTATARFFRPFVPLFFPLLVRWNNACFLSNCSRLCA